MKRTSRIGALRRIKKGMCTMFGCRHRAQSESPHCPEHQPALPFLDGSGTQPSGFGNVEVDHDRVQGRHRDDNGLGEASGTSYEAAS
jgi:hypothetical protein